MTLASDKQEFCLREDCGTTAALGEDKTNFG